MPTPAAGGPPGVRRVRQWRGGDTTATGVPTHPSPRRHGAAFARTCSPRPRETFSLALYRFPMEGAVNPDVRRSRRLARILAANPRAAIYGTIVASAVIATTAGGHESAALILEATLATLLVFWLAHVYADFLGHALRRASSRLRLMASVMVQELSMLVAPALSVSPSAPSTTMSLPCSIWRWHSAGPPSARPIWVNRSKLPQPGQPLSGPPRQLLGAGFRAAQ